MPNCAAMGFEWGDGALGSWLYRTLPVLHENGTEPGVGIEPTTYRLQGGCSAPELTRRTYFVNDTSNDHVVERRARTTS